MGEVYHDLSKDRPGLPGALLNRSEAYVMRLAALYALLDCQNHIGHSHLVAALTLWDYSERSVYLIFGDKTGDPIADIILGALKRNELTDTQISNFFHRNQNAGRLNHAKRFLEELGRITSYQRETNGRDETVWKIGCDKQQPQKPKRKILPL